MLSDPQYVALIVGVVAILVGGLLGFFISRHFGIVRSSSWTVDEFDEVVNAPIRPLVFLIFAVAFVYGFFTGTVSEGVFSQVFGVFVGWFFGKRDASKTASEALKQIQVVSEAIKK